MEPYRVIILPDRMIVLQMPNMDQHLSMLTQQFSQTCTPTFQAQFVALGQKVAFEFLCLSLLLDCVVKSATEQRERLIHAKLKLILSNVHHSLTAAVSRELEDLRLYKLETSRLKSSLHRITDTIHDVLNDADELLFMQLCRFVSHPEVLWSHKQTNTVETLCTQAVAFFGFYLLDLNELTTSLNLALQNIESAESQLTLQLETSRNISLVMFSLASLLATILGMGSFVGALFGMNLRNTHEASTYTFQTVTFGTVGYMIVIGASLFYWLFKVVLFIV